MALFSKSSKASARKNKGESDIEQLEPEPVEEAVRYSLEEHCDQLVGMVQPLAPFGMSLIDAWEHTLCEDIKSYSDVPPVAIAEIDGYAVRAADIMTTDMGYPPVLLLRDAPHQVVTQSTEAEGTVSFIAGGEAVWVQAGEQLPENADTVLASWQVVQSDSGQHLTIVVRAAPGDWVRPPQVEAADGALLMSAGTVLDDRCSALLAAAGFDRVMVRPRTRVAVVQVTDPPHETRLASGRAGGVGMHLINGACRADSATIWRTEIDLTDPDAARESISDELIRSDMVITIGGLNEEEADPRLVDLLNNMGDVNVVDVDMRPGQKQGFGLIGDDNLPLVMLPGDPTAALVSYHAFARPVLRRLMGVEPYAHEPILCYAERDFDAEVGVVQLVPCRLRQHGNRYLASEITPRCHSWLTTLATANGLVMLPPNRPRVFTGEAMGCWLLGDGPIAG